EAYYGELDRTRWGLIPVAQLDTYKGLIFATFDPAAPPLVEYLGDMTWYLDILLDQHADGTEVLGGIHKWTMPANWKFGADNFVGDMYHAQFTHLSAFKAGFGGSSAGAAKPSWATPGMQANPGGGHGVGGWLVGEDENPVNYVYGPLQD